MYFFFYVNKKINVRKDLWLIQGSFEFRKYVLQIHVYSRLISVKLRIKCKETEYQYPHRFSIFGFLFNFNTHSFL